jgi:hypothetical protein
MLNHFKRISPEQALAQHTHYLQASTAAAAEERAVRDREQLFHRGPGRPKKELVLQWCIDSWKRMQEGEGKLYIKSGWHNTVLVFFNALDPLKRALAVEEALAKQQQLDIAAHGEEQPQSEVWDGDNTDDEKDELDIMKERAQPSRTQPVRSSKKQGRVQRFGGGVDPTRIEIED